MCKSLPSSSPACAPPEPQAPPAMLPAATEWRRHLAAATLIAYAAVLLGSVAVPLLPGLVLSLGAVAGASPATSLRVLEITLASSRLAPDEAGMTDFLVNVLRMHMADASIVRRSCALLSTTLHPMALGVATAGAQ